MIFIVYAVSMDFKDLCCTQPTEICKHVSCESYCQERAVSNLKRGIQAEKLPEEENMGSQWEFVNLPNSVDACPPYGILL